EYVTQADTFVGCWDSKYFFYNGAGFWRPVTAIQHADIDGNDATQQDAGWLPQIATPTHPEWPSAHGCTTSAYAHAIAEFFGTKRLPGGITLSGATGHPDRHFVSTDDIVKENRNPRLQRCSLPRLGHPGIHPRAQGRAVGGEVLLQAGRRPHTSRTEAVAWHGDA